MGGKKIVEIPLRIIIFLRESLKIREKKIHLFHGITLLPGKKMGQKEGVEKDCQPRDDPLRRPSIKTQERGHYGSALKMLRVLIPS